MKFGFGIDLENSENPYNFITLALLEKPRQVINNK